MGCSASRSAHDFIHPQNTSDPGSHSGPPPVSRTRSLPAPLILHPAVGKGDTNHLVVLTSSSYGSLVLIDPNPNLSSEFCTQLGKSKSGNGSDPLDHLFPDSVVNAWELMEGLDDDFGYEVIESPEAESLENEKEVGLNQILKSYEFVELPDSRLHLSKPKDSEFKLKGTEDGIVLYYTSLRGIRKTYEECCDVRMIFRGFRVCIDERDISMDSNYRKELQSLLGCKAVSLPQVFIRGSHIGGVNEIKQLNESGELPKLLKGIPVRKDGLVCGSCGDARFVPCPSCNGSRKVFKNEETKLRRCQDCNENGLIRCPCCCP